MGIRFGTPDTVTLPLSDGDSIQIKTRITHGERDGMYAWIRNHAKDGRTAELAAYLVSWSSQTPYSPALSEDERIDTLNNLEAESFEEMYTALRTHQDSLTQEKKLQSGGNGSSAISSSPVPTIGATTT